MRVHSQTHAGSLPRPDDLRVMIADKAAGKSYDEAALAKRLPSAVEEVVKKQMDCGIDVVNDGEYGKSNFTNYVRERIGGFEVREHRGGKEELLSIIARDSRKFEGYFEAHPRPRSREGMGFRDRCSGGGARGGRGCHEEPCTHIGDGAGAGATAGRGGVRGCLPSGLRRCSRDALRVPDVGAPAV